MRRLAKGRDEAQRAHDAIEKELGMHETLDEDGARTLGERMADLEAKLAAVEKHRDDLLAIHRRDSNILRDLGATDSCTHDAIRQLGKRIDEAIARAEKAEVFVMGYGEKCAALNAAEKRIAELEANR